MKTINLDPLRAIVETQPLNRLGRRQVMLLTGCSSDAARRASKRIGPKPTAEQWVRELDRVQRDRGETIHAAARRLGAERHALKTALVAAGIVDPRAAGRWVRLQPSEVDRVWSAFVSGRQAHVEQAVKARRAARVCRCGGPKSAGSSLCRRCRSETSSVRISAELAREIYTSAEPYAVGHRFDLLPSQIAHILCGRTHVFATGGLVLGAPRKLAFLRRGAL